MRCKALVVLVLGVALAGCGSSGAHSSGAKKSASTAHVSAATQAADTFATHAGLAFGTFYHFIYAPYQAGEFRSIMANKAELAHAAAVATYVASQIDQATAAVSDSASLARLLVPMKTLDEGFRAALAKLKTGQFKVSEIETANLAISAIKGSAADAGMPISESTPSAI